MIRRKLASAIGAVSSLARATRSRFLDQMLLQAERDRILTEISRVMPENPILAGRKIYAQSDEDGIINEIFRRIGSTSRIAIEFGCGKGIENNTHALLLDGWRGLWVDGDPRNIRKIRQSLKQNARGAPLLLSESFVTKDNISGICQDAIAYLQVAPNTGVDLLSVDLDGNDLHLLEKVLHISPRVICCEYNAAIGPEIRTSVSYDPEHQWKSDDYMGASLSAFCDLLEQAGYVLICCNISGANAFFVERENAHLFGDYPTKELFQPPRYHFIFLEDYHPRTMKFLADRCSYAMLGEIDVGQ